MRKFLIVAFLCQLSLFGTQQCKAQSVVNMSVKQNPLFSVSTNDVSAVLDGQPLTLGADVVITGGSGVYTYQWYKGSEKISTASTIQIGEPGEYSLDVKDQCDCLQTIAFHITGTAGVEAIAVDDVKQINVFSLNGQLVKVINSSKCDLESLPQGQYIINMVSTDGRVSVKKVNNK